jgi:hypothetical protein
MATLAIIVAVLSFALSSVTAWLTWFRRGTIEMTQPTVIYFGPQAPPSRGSSAQPKVYFRALLFSTSKRGRAIESMHVALSHDAADQDFSTWVYGDHQQLVQGSGLFVGETGIATGHHFLVLRDSAPLRFTEGRYKLDVFAKLLKDKRPKQLSTQELTVSPETAASMAESEAGVYFELDPGSARYLPRVDKWEASADEPTGQSLVRTR